MNYYPHHIGDFNNATRHLTRVERSVYRDATELYYDTEKPLSLEIPMLERKLMCKTDEEKEALGDIIAEFFVRTDEGYFHQRCESEIEKYRSNLSAKAKAGRASAEARRFKRESKTTQPNACSTPVQQTSNKIQLTKNQEPRTKNQEPSISAVASCHLSDNGKWKSRINKIYARRETTKWSDRELKAFKKLTIEEEDMRLIEKYCDPKNGSKYRRKDIQTLLNNWNGELDRARAEATKPSVKLDHARVGTSETVKL